VKSLSEEEEAPMLPDPLGFHTQWYFIRLVVRLVKWNSHFVVAKLPFR
jgi:hypothetical protein